MHYSLACAVIKTFFKIGSTCEKQKSMLTAFNLYTTQLETFIYCRKKRKFLFNGDDLPLDLQGQVW